MKSKFWVLREQKEKLKMDEGSNTAERKLKLKATRAWHCCKNRCRSCFSTSHSVRGIVATYLAPLVKRLCSARGIKFYRSSGQSGVREKRNYCRVRKPLGKDWRKWLHLFENTEQQLFWHMRYLWSDFPCKVESKQSLSLEKDLCFSLTFKRPANHCRMLC